MKTGGQSPEAAPGEGSAPRLVLSGPARGADRARHSLGFSHGNGGFPWKNGRSLTAPAAAAPSRREHPPPGPCGTEGPGLSRGEARRPFLPHRCGGETPPWPRRGRRRFRQWRRVLRGSASAGRAGQGRAEPGGAPQGPGREGKGGKVPSTARTGTCPWRESSGGHRVDQRDGGEEEGVGVVQLWEKGLG